MKTGKLLSNYELSSFCRQTYYLLQAGITPSDGMDILLQDTDQHFMREMITQIRDTCLQGEKFSKALEATGCFPEYAIHMISLGEESGHLSTIMLSLSEYYEREEAISDGIKEAVRYPLIMIGMMLLVILVLIMKVLPIFNQVFAQLGTQMTGFALSLLNVSNILSRYSLIFVIVLAVIVIGILCIAKSQSGKQAVKSMYNKLPFFKKFSDSIAAGRFASGMSLTLSSGLDTYESLDLIGQLVENKDMEEKIGLCRKYIQEGDTFSEALKKAKIFTMFYTHMVVIGFRSGSLDSVMKQIAMHYEEDTDQKIRSLISTLEPTLVIILSLFVGLILLSVIMPLMGIMSMIG